jgi:DNA-binding NarL/FixJ family response regulator
VPKRKAKAAAVKAKAKTKTKAKAAASRPAAGGMPSTSRVRQWVKQSPFVTPKGMQVKRTTDHGKPALLVSFPLPHIDWQKELTEAEIAVVHDVLAGLSNAEIGDKRGTALRTVANQVAAIFRKLGVSSRLELSLYVLTDRATLRRR